MTHESLLQNDRENGEREYDAGNTGTNVFAISTHDQVPLPLPRVFYAWGKEPSTKSYIRLDGEFVYKVEVDRGAWGEYDDNPIDVKDWQYIMIEVRKFADCAFVLVSHSGTYTVVDTEWEQCVLGGSGTMIVLDSTSQLNIVVLERLSTAFKLFENSDLEYSQVSSPHAHQWGENKNGLIYYTAHNTGHKDPRGQGAIAQIGSTRSHEKDTPTTICNITIRLKLNGLELQYHDGSNNRIRSIDEVNITMGYDINHHGYKINICNNNKLNDSINTSSRFTTRNVNGRGYYNNDMIENGMSYYQQCRTTINGGSATIITHTNTSLIIDGTDNKISHDTDNYTSTHALDMQHNDYVHNCSTNGNNLIGYDTSTISTSDNLNMVTLDNGLDDLIPITGHETTSVDGEHESISISDDNVNTILTSSTTSTFEELTNDEATQTTTNTDHEKSIGTNVKEENRINIGGTNIVNFEEAKVGSHKLEIDSFGHMLHENMGSNCLASLDVRGKLHGLWGATCTYQGKYNWYKLDVGE